MQLSPNFSLAEFCRSDSAVRHGIANDLPIELLPNARRTAELLERIRVRFGGRPIRITSGYRCLLLNALLGSKPTSDHVLANAADIEPPEGMPLVAFAGALAKMNNELGIGQLILEYPDRDGWVHVSPVPPVLAVNRILTITAAGTVPGIRG